MEQLKTLLSNIADLVKVKSLWSIVCMAMFIYLIVTEKISGEIAMATITAIVTYYFTKQEVMQLKKESTDTEEGDVGK